MLGQLVEQFLKRKRNFWIAEIVIAFIPVVVIAIFSEAVKATGIYKLFGTLDAIMFTLVLNLATLITSIERDAGRQDKVRQRSTYRKNAVLTLMVYPVWLIVASPHEGEMLTTLINVAHAAVTVYYCTEVRKKQIYLKEEW